MSNGQGPGGKHTRPLKEGGSAVTHENIIIWEWAKSFKILLSHTNV